jgi:Leucine-rich repeat (LRR) protein
MVAPLHHVQVVDFCRYVDRIVPSPFLRHVRRLSLMANSIRQAHVALLAASPHLVNLELLDLGRNHLGIAACEALARANLPALRSLDLSDNPIKERGLAALLGAPWASHLVSLDLSGCALGPSSLTRIASSAPRLRRLGLSGVQGVPSRAVAEFVSAPLPCLEFLGLSHLGTSSVAARLAANPSLRNLRELWVHYGPANAWAREVLNSPNLAGLQRLRINWPTDARLAAQLQARFGANLNPDWSRDDMWDDSPLLPGPGAVG